MTVLNILTRLRPRHSAPGPGGGALPGVNRRPGAGRGRRLVQRGSEVLLVLAVGVLGYVYLMLQLNSNDGALVLARPAWIAREGARYAGCQFAYLSGSQELGSVQFAAVAHGPDVELTARNPLTWSGYLLPSIESLELDTRQVVHLSSLGFRVGTGFLWPVGARLSTAPADRAEVPVDCHVDAANGRLQVVPRKPPIQRVREAQVWLGVIAGIAAALRLMVRKGGEG